MREFFFKVVRTAFRRRRKMLKNALAKGGFASGEVLAAAFEALDIAPQRRAETLDIAEFAALANFFVSIRISEDGCLIASKTRPYRQRLQADV